MPIDRVFARKGFGVVVTGTLVAGTLREGEVVAVGPTGPEHRVLAARVRGLQAHGAAMTEVRAGSRVAVNLAGLEVAEVPRGQWLFREGAVEVTTSFDATVRLRPETRRALGRRTKLEVAAGATYALATVSLLEGDSLEPGAEALARVSTDRPLVLRVGERLVLRGPPSLAGLGGTVGGLTVVRPVAERVRRRAVALERARRSAAGDARARAEVELEAAGLRGVDGDGLLARAGYAAAEGGAGVAVGADRWVSRPALEALQAKVLEALSGHHARHPDERGLGRSGLAAMGDDAVVDAALGALVAQGRVTREGDVIARAGWRARSADETPYLAQVRAALSRAGTAAPRVEEMAQQMGTDATGLSLAIKRLVDRGEVLKVTSELYVDAAAMGALEAGLVAWLREKGSIDAQGFKELSGLSRKWAIGYLEWFDARKVTLRVGDKRKLRGG
jgi:selenocysteine-specific elongation factor